MKEIPAAPPTQCASCPGIQQVGIRLHHSIGAGQPGRAPYWELAPLATAINYLVCIVPIVYMAFQARPTSSMGAQPDSGMGCDKGCHTAHNWSGPPRILRKSSSPDQGRKFIHQPTWRLPCSWRPRC
ncbi:hypothetical protein DSO57_1004694 [Entomophthora muscae]|uniref:Uncharacterized protein n=1 Tax=Entomophthora muscae TaxID=34485 RepID=A0ACC2U5Z2_9FUNG|nr:hypothetical protein DSO57_1004694 [Entomophthora muscae]